MCAGRHTNRTSVLIRLRTAGGRGCLAAAPAAAKQAAAGCAVRRCDAVQPPADSACGCTCCMQPAVAAEEAGTSLSCTMHVMHLMLNTVTCTEPQHYA